MATVTFDKATRLFPGSTKPAVDQLDLQIEDGEFLVLVGPSGCGKSTSLRMLAGLEDVNAGRILIGDRDVTQVPPKDRDIAMVFQSYALYPHMSVADNMGFALKIAGVAKDEIRSRVDDAAKILDLTQYLERKPKALSGGSRWAGPSSASRRSSSWTSPCRTSTPSSGSRPARRLPRCSAGSASRRSTSRTTRPKP
jgi:multiple sugar transport system ATP-binding protein